MQFWKRRPTTAVAHALPAQPVDALVEPPQLYGRDEVLADIASRRVGTVILAGDPGVGKSQLARTAAAAAEGAPPPLSVGYRQGALQAALFATLAEALAMDAANRGTAEKLGLILAGAAKRVAGTRFEALAGAARHVVVEIARDKLGDAVVDLGADFVTATRTTLDEQLMRRVTQMCDPDALKVFYDFADEAEQLLDHPVVLSLDIVTSLHEDDFRQLLDLASAPCAAVLRIAFATRDETAAAQVRELRVAGAHVVDVKPLSDEALREWLAPLNITHAAVDDIVRTTAGYPLFVVAAIEHVRAGRSISQLRGHDGFVAQMEMNFHALGPAEQQACVALAAFATPPPPTMITELVGCTPAQWHVLEGRLSERKIFAAVVDDRVWFHELGRRAIWDSAMTAPQRTSSAERAIAVIVDAVESRGNASYQDALDLSRLFPHAPDTAALHPGVSDVLDLAKESLAVYGAVLELTEEQHVALDPSDVVQHARQAFAITAKFEEQLRHLSDVGLIALAENDHSAVIVGIWPSPASRLVLAGRMAQEYGRPLLPGVATATFDDLFRSRIGVFHAASYGVGDPDLTYCSSTLREMDFDRDEDMVEINDRHGLIARGRWGSVALHYAISFDQTADRDRALAALDGFTEDRYVGNPFTVESVLSWPRAEPVPELLMTQGALLGSAHSEFTSLRSHPGLVLAPPSPSIGDHLRARLAARKAARDSSDPFVRRLLRLNEPSGYLFYQDGEGVMVAAVRGFDGVVEIAPVANPFGAFARDRMADLAALPPEASIRRMTLYGGGLRGDPVAVMLTENHQRIKAFNDKQRFPRKTLRLDASTLTEELLGAMETRTRIAMTYAQAGLFADPHPSPPTRHLRVLVRPGLQKAGWVTGADGTVTWTSTVSESNRVDVRVLGSAEPRDWDLVDFQRAFGLEKEPNSFHHSVLIGGLEDLLGLGDGALRIELSD